MSVIRRITKFLTPPPREIQLKHESPEWRPPETIDSSQLRPLLRSLLRSDPSDESTVREKLSELKEMAQTYGGYVTASEIQNFLTGFPSRDEKGREYKKARGYELAGDLYLQNLFKRIRAIVDQDLPMGPNEFGGYCTEVLSCLFLGNKHWKGIEAGLSAVDELQVRACGPASLREVHYTLADRAVQCMIDQCIEQLERDERLLNRQRRKSRKGDSDPGIEEAKISGIDQRVIQYLAEVRERNSHVFEGIRKLATEPPAAFNLPVEERPLMKSQLAYLGKVIECVKGAEAYPLNAWLAEQAGLLQEKLNPGSGKSLLLAAAQSLEAQGDIDTNLKLRRLAERRYRKAYELYNTIDDAERANGTREKIVTLSKNAA